MNTDILLIIGIVASVTALITVKTHMAFVILALCAGFVLSELVGESVFTFFAQWIDPLVYPLLSIVLIALLLLPAFLIAHRFRSTQHGLARVLQQIIPAMALSLLTIVLILDRLPSATVQSISETSYLIGNLQSLSAFLVLFAVGAALFDVLTKHAHENHRKGKRGPGRPSKY